MTRVQGEAPVCSGGRVSFIIFLMLSGHWKLKLLMSSRGCCTPVSSRSLWMGIIQLSKPMPHLRGGGRSYPSHFKDFTSPLIPLGVITYTYCMKPPNIKAPKCTLLSIQCFIIQGQRSQVLTGLATAHCEHRWGQLTLESPFRIVESG